MKYFFLLTLFFSVLGLAEEEYFNTVEGSDASSLCCVNEFYPCYKSCPRPDRCPECPAWDKCARECEKKHCREMDKECPKKPETPSSLKETFSVTEPLAAPQQAKTGRIQHDGRLPGPGLIKYEAHNRHSGGAALSVNGIVYGRKPADGAIVILKKSKLTELPPKGMRVFELYVTQTEFDEWSRLYGKLTIALTTPPEQGANYWRYENLLREEDTKLARPGEYEVKGAFHFKGKK